MTLIAAKWKEFAHAAGQWKKSKGLTSPTLAKEGFDESVTETPGKDSVTGITVKIGKKIRDLQNLI